MAHFAAALKATLEALWSSNTWLTKDFLVTFSRYQQHSLHPTSVCFVSLSHSQDFVLRVGVALRSFALRAVTGKETRRSGYPLPFRAMRMIKTEHKLCSPLTASIRVTNSVLASVSVLVRNQTPTAPGAFITGPWRGVFWGE